MTEEQQRSKANIYHSRIPVDIGPPPFRRLSEGDVGTKILSAPEISPREHLRSIPSSLDTGHLSALVLAAWRAVWALQPPQAAPGLLFHSSGRSRGSTAPEFLATYSPC